MPSLLFVCVANSCRSQMAEAIAKQMNDGTWDVWSAGSAPSGMIHPLAATLMKELGLELSAHHSKGLDQVPRHEWDYVVTMGCGDRCPTIPARRRLDWEIQDPTGLELAQARRVRDDLSQRIKALMGSGGLTGGNA